MIIFNIDCMLCFQSQCHKMKLITVWNIYFSHLLLVTYQAFSNKKPIINQYWSIKLPMQPSKNFQQQSPSKLPSKPKQPAIRKIPETLVQSYDMVTLKQQRRRRYKPEKVEKDEADLIKEMAQKLRPVYGPCLCHYQGDQQTFETVYQLSAGSLILSKFDIINLKNIKKIKLKKKENSMQESSSKKQLKNFSIKINWEQENQPNLVLFILPKTMEDAYFLYAAIITRKMMIDDFMINQISNAYREDFSSGINKIKGEIFKMSSYLKKWERRKIIIEENLQMESFKDEKCTFKIQSIKQLWTRFSMHNSFFIIKMHHGLEKTEIGIPLIDFTNIESSKNWLFMFAKMIK